MLLFRIITITFLFKRLDILRLENYSFSVSRFLSIISKRMGKLLRPLVISMCKMICFAWFLVLVFSGTCVHLDLNDVEEQKVIFFL